MGCSRGSEPGAPAPSLTGQQISEISDCSYSLRCLLVSVSTQKSEEQRNPREKVYSVPEITGNHQLPTDCRDWCFSRPFLCCPGGETAAQKARGSGLSSQLVGSRAGTRALWQAECSGLWMDGGVRGAGSRTTPSVTHMLVSSVGCQDHSEEMISLGPRRQGVGTAGLGLDAVSDTALMLSWEAQPIPGDAHSGKCLRCANPSGQVPGG